MSPPIRIGLLRLVDSAPVLVAEQRGLFEQFGLDVHISIEPSWANAADKLTYGLLDAAVMLPPLVLAAAMGLRGPPARSIVPMGLSQGGNTIVLGNQAASGVGVLDHPRGRLLPRWLRKYSSGCASTNARTAGRCVSPSCTISPPITCCCVIGWPPPVPTRNGTSRRWWSPPNRWWMRFRQGASTGSAPGRPGARLPRPRSPGASSWVPPAPDGGGGRAVRLRRGGSGADLAADGVSGGGVKITGTAPNECPLATGSLNDKICAGRFARMGTG